VGDRRRDRPSVRDHRDGDVEGFSVGPKEVYYSGSTLASPANLYAVGFDGGKPRQLTRLNQEELAARRLGEYQQFNFAGANNDNVFGYVVKPANFKRDQKYPVAFLIHGGPQGSMANVWHWRWNAQTFAGAGYGVVMIDFTARPGTARPSPTRSAAIGAASRSRT